MSQKTARDVFGMIVADIFVDLGEKMIPGSVVGCAGNYFGVRLVSLLHVFSELDDIQLTFVCFFSSFGGTLGLIFLTSEGPGSRSENR